jgi:2-polyprenyl-3-methyl-5-hydroxy-6-metoxy-1,4-benzoquinol methylase
MNSCCESPSIDELKAVYEPHRREHLRTCPKGTKELGLIYRDLIKSAHPSAKSVLEVGCNTGFILKGLNDLGYSVWGTDLSSTAVRAAKKYFDLDSVYLSEFPPEEKVGSFDVLIASHVIEHALEPRAFVEQCARFLRKDGIMIIRTPNVESLGMRCFRGHYPVFCPPIHLNYFSMRTLSSVLDRHFKVIRSETGGDWNDPRNTVFNSLVAVSHLLGVKQRLRASTGVRIPSADANGVRQSSSLYERVRKAAQVSESFSGRCLPSRRGRGGREYPSDRAKNCSGV